MSLRGTESEERALEVLVNDLNQNLNTIAKLKSGNKLEKLEVVKQRASGVLVNIIDHVLFGHASLRAYPEWFNDMSNKKQFMQWLSNDDLTLNFSDSRLKEVLEKLSKHPDIQEAIKSKQKKEKKEKAQLPQPRERAKSPPPSPKREPAFEKNEEEFSYFIKEMSLLFPDKVKKNAGTQSTDNKAHIRIDLGKKIDDTEIVAIRNTIGVLSEKLPLLKNPNFYREFTHGDMPFFCFFPTGDPNTAKRFVVAFKEEYQRQIRLAQEKEFSYFIKEMSTLFPQNVKMNEGTPSTEGKPHIRIDLNKKMDDREILAIRNTIAVLSEKNPSLRNPNVFRMLGHGDKPFFCFFPTGDLEAVKRFVEAFKIEYNRQIAAQERARYRSPSPPPQRRTPSPEPRRGAIPPQGSLKDFLSRAKKDVEQAKYWAIELDNPESMNQSEYIYELDKKLKQLQGKPEEDQARILAKNLRELIVNAKAKGKPAPRAGEFAQKLLDELKKIRPDLVLEQPVEPERPKTPRSPYRKR